MSKTYWVRPVSLGETIVKLFIYNTNTKFNSESYFPKKDALYPGRTLLINPIRLLISVLLLSTAPTVASFVTTGAFLLPRPATVPMAALGAAGGVTPVRAAVAAAAACGSFLSQDLV